MAPTAEDAASAALDAVEVCLREIDRWIPVLGDFLDMISDWPEAEHVRLYDLAEQYGSAAELYSGHLEDLNGYMRDLDAWQGDGASEIARQQLTGYFEELSSMAETLGGVQQYVHGQALEIESMKWMAVVALVMMIIALIQMIITIWTGIGAAAGAVAISGARVTIQTVAKELFRKLMQETIRGGIRKMVQTGFTNVGRRALMGALANAAFMGGIKAGIMGIQALQGHDPFVDGWEQKFAIGLADSLIAGAIGGPLTFGANSRFVEAVAFGVGQLGDNLIRMGLDSLFRATGNQDWAERNGLYSGMGLGDAFQAIMPASILGEMMEPAGRGHRPDHVQNAVNNGANNLFNNLPDPAPGGAQQTGNQNQGAPAPVLAPGGLPAGSQSQTGGPAPGTQGAGSQSGNQGAGSQSGGQSGSQRGGQTGSQAGSQSGSQGAGTQSGSQGAGTQSGGQSGSRDGGQSGSQGSRGSNTDGESSEGSAQTQGTQPDGASGTPPAATDGSSSTPPAESDGASGTPSQGDGASQTNDSSSGRSTATPTPTPATPATPDGSTSTETGGSTTNTDGTASQQTSSEGDRAETDQRRATPEVTPPVSSGTVEGSTDGSATQSESSDAASSQPPSEGDGTSTRDSSGESSTSESSSARASAEDGPSTDGSSSEDSSSEDSSSEGTGSTPPPVQPDAARPDTGQSSSQPSSSQSREARWWNFGKRLEQRIEAQFTEGAANFFGGTLQGSTVRPPALTPDLVQRVLDARPESLSTYGNRMRGFIEQHFTEVDAAGTRRPLDDAQIAAKLADMRGATPAPQGGSAPSPGGDGQTGQTGTGQTETGRTETGRTETDRTETGQTETDQTRQSEQSREESQQARSESETRRSREEAPALPGFAPMPGPVLTPTGSASPPGSVAPPGGTTPAGGTSQSSGTSQSGRDGDGSSSESSTPPDEGQGQPEPSAATGGSSVGSSSGGDGTTGTATPDTTGTTGQPASPGDGTRQSLMDRVRDRVSRLFGRDSASQQTRQEAAERAAYEANMRQAQAQLRQTIESDPRVQQHRQTAANAAHQAQQARTEAAAATNDAGLARAEQQAAQQRAQQYRNQAARLDPSDPQRGALQRAAQQADQYSYQRAFDAQNAEARASAAQQRAQAADATAAQANRDADQITQNAATHQQAAWRMANVDTGAGFRQVGPAHPGPQVSMVSGRPDVPPPVSQNRPYDQPGGLRRPLAADQARLQRALSDGQGGYVRTPDPTGPWLRLVNAFGLGDPTRTQNCQDAVASLFDTFVHGRPTVAAPRTYDGYSGSSPHVPSGGEADGPGRMEDLSGGRFQSLVGNLSTQSPSQRGPQVDRGFDQIRQQLLAGGHGSFAAIITGWQSGSSHAWAAVNHNGNIYFVDPQVGTVVAAVDGPNGVSYIDPHTGQDVGNPIHDRSQITMMDALVVDGSARPMPFANNPPGTWNSRPLTPDYLASQSPQVQASDGAANDHAAARAAQEQARSETQRAERLRQHAQRHATEAQGHALRAQADAQQAQTHRAERDAAAQRATRLEQEAQRHDAYARQYAELAQRGTPDAQQAQHMADQHRALADGARQQANDQRAQAQQHEGERQRAEAKWRQAEQQRADAEARAAAVARDAATAEHAAAASAQRAAALETSYGQRANQAAQAYDAQAAQAAADAAHHSQQAQQHPPHDPLRRQEEARAAHHNRLEQNARQAAHHHRVAAQHQQAAAARDARAEWYDQAAQRHERQAAVEERDARTHEQRRAAAEARYRQAAAVDPQVAQRFRDQANHFAQARDAAQARAAQQRQDAQTARQTAATERAEAANHRNARDQFESAAREWVQQTRREDRFDPGSQTPSGRTFDPENLPDGLRQRYDALTDPRAREQFARVYERARDDAGVTRALEGMERGAARNGTTLEDVLVEQHEKAAARQAVTPPPPDVVRDIDQRLREAERVRQRIDAYAQAHPEVRGIDRWRRSLDAEITALENEREGHGTPSPERHGRSIQGIDGEVALAERSRGVVEVAMTVEVRLPDGRVLRTDIDVVAEGGRVWLDAKSYEIFGPDSYNVRHHQGQIARQLEIIEHSGHRVDGEPPRLEWVFVRGVHPDVVPLLEGTRVYDPETGAELPHRVTVTDGRPPDTPPPPPPPSGAPPAPAAPPGAVPDTTAPTEVAGEQGPPDTSRDDDRLYSREVSHTNQDVLVNGGDAPFTLEEVHRVAEILGIDLTGVDVRLITDPEEIRYLDYQGASAYTPVEAGGREIRLGPAAFADAETLAVTIAHEYKHVEQIRSGETINTATRRELEDAAYAVEPAALERFRAHSEGGSDGTDGTVLDREGVRPGAEERSAGVRDGAGGRDSGGHGALGRDDQGANDGTGRGVRDQGGAGDRPDDASARTDRPDSGGARPGPDQHDLTRHIGPPTDGSAPATHADKSSGMPAPDDRAGQTETGDAASPDATPAYVDTAEAVRLVRQHLHATRAGYAFYPAGDRVLSFAHAVPPRPGVVTFDLHGSPDGFHIDGRVLTPEQFAHAIDVMRQEGRIHLGAGDHVRLTACDVARGDHSPAARFARASGTAVTAPTERVWTNRRGEERVTSAELRGGRWVPTEPDNGRWRTFEADGQERGAPHTESGPTPEYGGSEAARSGTDGASEQPASDGDPRGPVLTPDVLESEYGMPERNQEAFQAYAEQHGLVIDVRPTNAAAVRWLAEGAMPKPLDIKAKTIDERDVLLGAQAGNVGLVGYFEPRLPARPDGMSDAQWESVEKRYRQRLNEYAELSETMARLAASGRFTVSDGVVYAVEGEGGQRPITGDHDLFDIRRTDGSRLDPDEYGDVIEELRGQGIGVQHGAHMYWQPQSAFELQIHADIAAKHQPGGEEGLVRFAPGEPPRLVDASTPVHEQTSAPPRDQDESPSGGDEYQARSGTDPPSDASPPATDRADLDRLAAEASRPGTGEGATGRARTQVYAIAERQGLLGNDATTAERREALGDQLSGQTRQLLETSPSLADRARVERLYAREAFDHTGFPLDQAVRGAESLPALLESGVQPHEIARHATPETLRRLFDLSESQANDLATLLGDPQVQTMLHDSWGSPPFDPPILAESVLAKLGAHPELVRMMLDLPDLRNALALRPVTLDHLASHQQAIDTLREVVEDIQRRGPEAVLADPEVTVEPTPLTDDQRQTSEAAKPEEVQDRQTGFDQRRQDDAAYRAEYLDSMYVQAVRAQAELNAMAAEVAGDTGEPAGRSEPKNRQRAEDKVVKYRGEVSRLKDLAAAKVAFDTMADLYRGLEQVRQHPGVTIVKLDDRFARPQDSGYRDIQMSVRTSNGHVAEFRLHLKSLDEVADWEHALYEIRRDLDTFGKERRLTPPEEAIRFGLLQRERELFWQALRPALGEGQP
ncbi:toxin glutamine deamidase domain-containing protein [Phytohabitans sp. ZYX-F-186]|uniref:Toxin glutamine deamidase domain-containing protein n=1 Tax=Phytohabitans maris TaxID=3071409 RepID=A0ABU0ZN02_9ACTN|nr:toxin glutamine deamidase domain-containing protein [Phytohabitans sp. ZYX-F-186]MDQ7907787.1 toxin glutamine deamidase domain-containing protein [Phytohabitans sp. ZYX-F-186]